MGIISWIILGLLAGILAKWIMPGKDGGGFIMTTLLGIAGAVVGGWVGSLIGIGTAGGLSLGSIAIATVGALILLFLYNRFAK
ncbi:GlsB/YeaQ/YmgE family stress response membrane protein [Enterovibrio sp. 27052020O]|uniref:GlsB/YeaQ/YmgE family stress response membrane protein n=1 Tax=Enterovibrio sp. 27052020O TaxID=3241166 RepID=UPI00388DD42D